MLPHRHPLKQWASTHFDMIIIGGGISGAGIARDATLRGLRVALFEQGDYASGTSSRTSKLIHGGIRYLEQGNLPLVFEASRERQILQRLAPHLVCPLPFLFPIYQGAKWGKGMIKMGMLLYDLLALFRNIHPHRMLNHEETLQLEPDLLPDGLLGAALYYDCLMDDARLCLENILEAQALGAATRNYAQVIGLVKERGGRITGVNVRDLISGEEEAILGKVVINAAGPWVDDLCRMESPVATPKLRRTRGSHIILPSLTHNRALVVRSQKDQRVFFIIPWQGLSLVGTTDIDFEGSPGDVRCPPDDLTYLLGETQRLFPKHHLGSEQVIATFAGVRPLVHSDERDASSVSRETKIYQSASGLLSITGGKFTTYRYVAERVVDKILKLLPENKTGRCTTRIRPLWGGNLGNIEVYIRERRQELYDRYSLDPIQASHLITTYGTRYTQILDLLQENKELGERLHPSLPHIKGEILHTIQRESAITLSDVLRRRTTLASAPTGPMRGSSQTPSTSWPLNLDGLPKKWRENGATTCGRFSEKNSSPCKGREGRFSFYLP